ncbi:MAG: Rieske 2Fe-2S domain-containing protein, partial [Caulobacteraceae bacterium]|nr:Rieske 2Fe-2S domain-containing protein [Caulobacteraceae bacterium]
MLKREDNETLTRLGSDTPMGKLVREYWMPALRGASLSRGGAPVRVTLCGEKLVAFRGEDGVVGILQENCPHRLTSLALGRNEDNTLTCIFHGWKIDREGRVLDMPAEAPERRAALCARVRARAYPAREAGGMVWAYMGAAVEPPAFPEFEFNTLPESHVAAWRAVVPYNWVQGVEAHIDAAHVGILHSGHVRSGNDQGEQLSFTLDDQSPTTEVRQTNYGLREAALRPQADGTVHARIREVVFPFFTFIASPADRPGQGRASVPIDEHTAAEWYIMWRSDRPITEEEIRVVTMGSSGDPDNFASSMGDASNNWLQDRASMERHWSGYPESFVFEDFVCEASMGSIVDRSQEHLGPSDIVIVQARRALLEAARSFGEGAAAPWRDEVNFGAIRG